MTDFPGQPRFDCSLAALWRERAPNYGADEDIVDLALAYAAPFTRAEDVSYAPGSLRGRPVRIGSVTKSLTATLALLVAAEGLIDLDEPCAATLRIASPALTRITWRSVLGHTSGLPLEAHPRQWSVGSPVLTKNQLREAAASVQLLPLPSGMFHYSNFGYGLLAAALEERTGESFERLLERRLLAPLEMSRTTLFRPAEAVVGWCGHRGSRTRAPEVDFGACHAAGELWSTLEDLMTWGLCLIGCRTDVVSSDILAQLTTPRTIVHAALPTVQATGVQLLIRQGRSAITTSGVLPGYKCAITASNTLGVGAAWINDSDSPLDLVETGEAALLSATKESERAADEKLTALLGTWYLDGQRVDIRSAAGILTAAPPGAEALPPLFRNSVQERTLKNLDCPIKLVDDDHLLWGSHVLTRDPLHSASRAASLRGRSRFLRSDSGG